MPEQSEDELRELVTVGGRPHAPSFARDAGADLVLAAQIWLRRHPTGRPPIGLVNPQ